METTLVVKSLGDARSSLRAALLFAARQGTTVRLVLNSACSDEQLDRELRLAEWALETKFGLPCPQVVVEIRGERGESATSPETAASSTEG